MKIGDLIQFLPKQKYRSFTISSTPLLDPKNLSITVSQVDENALTSTYLTTRCKVNDLLLVGLRAGSFRLPVFVGFEYIVQGLEWKLRRGVGLVGVFVIARPPEALVIDVQAMERR